MIRNVRSELNKQAFLIKIFNLCFDSEVDFNKTNKTQHVLGETCHGKGNVIKIIDLPATIRYNYKWDLKRLSNSNDSHFLFVFTTVGDNENDNIVTLDNENAT